MLDETDNTTLKSGGNSTAGIPPRRRRAASRPASSGPVETMGAPVAITAAGSGGSIVTSDVEASDLPRPRWGDVARRRALRTTLRLMFRRSSPRADAGGARVRGHKDPGEAASYPSWCF